MNRILVTDGMDKAAMETLRQAGFEVIEQFYEPDALGEALREVDAVIIRSATKIKQPQIDAARGGRLKLIIRAGVGMDNIDIPYAEAAGIACRNTPCASSNAVAELAIALLFSCARYISVAGHTMREEKWEKKYLISQTYMVRRMFVGQRKLLWREGIICLWSDHPEAGRQ